MAEEKGDIISERTSLPVDLITDILSRLPVKTLGRMKLVRKSWYSLINDHEFIQRNLRQSLVSNNVSFILRAHSLFSVSLDECEHKTALELEDPLESFKGRTDIVGSCNGLLCLCRGEEHAFLWNPSTRLHQKLPVSTFEYPLFSCRSFTVYGFGFDTSTDDYKVIKIVQFCNADQHSWDSDVKVYSLGTDCWRSVENIPYQLTNNRGHGVFANSALHWIAKGELNSKTVLISFDLNDEKCREVPMPNFGDDKFGMTVGVLGEKLSLHCCFYRVRTDIWVMGEYGVKDSWSKLFSFTEPLNLGLKPICYSNKGEVILVKNLSSLVLFSLSTQRARKLNVVGVPNFFDAKMYVRSLVPPSVMNRKEEKEWGAMVRR